MERLRMCAACRVKKDKTELIRVVRTPQGGLQIDERGKLNGRGAYICKTADCLKRAQKIRAFERMLKIPVPQEMFEQLGAHVE
ncbi:hypothetical protein FACS1894217_06190 [Clostridia bacterium]|nr:hypothetical protein FACS1894217_06190 [Clostridia bacterium]